MTEEKLKERNYTTSSVIELENAMLLLVTRNQPTFAANPLLIFVFKNCEKNLQFHNANCGQERKLEEKKDEVSRGRFVAVSRSLRRTFECGYFAALRKESDFKKRMFGLRLIRIMEGQNNWNNHWRRTCGMKETAR